MPTHNDETILQRYQREHRVYERMNMSKAEELANRNAIAVGGDLGFETAYELRRLSAINAELLEALKKSLDALQKANEQPNGPINDTIWLSRFETLFDFMAAAIAKAQGDQP